MIRSAGSARRPWGAKVSTIGRFLEFSVATQDILESLHFYKTLGFIELKLVMSGRTNTRSSATANSISACMKRVSMRRE